ncbi:MAG: 3'-5' exonuclease [Chloroflexi bacterium]|uniref:3'-5' exonuclease n=1 Tax=Candidatus Flexifilum breve TaxID=3140694 RepID=UPI0031368CA4|nr:3'-5' exonuclease [Chloroflexota bacterium]
MWRCRTLDGEKVNVFKHADESKNTFALFEAAGYAATMLALTPGDELTWENSPVGVTLQRTPDGKWWNVIGVDAMPAGALPDPQFIPDPELYRSMASEQASALLYPLIDTVIWDTETNDVGSKAEIVSIAIVHCSGEVLVNTLVRPEHPEKLLQNGSGLVNGLTPEALATAPTLPEVWPQICGALDNSNWVIYNAKFDAPLLERECVKHGLRPPYPVGTTCAMELAAKFNGEWDKARQQHTPKKLSEIAEALGVEVVDAHNALGDALTTLAVLKAIAAQSEEEPS